MIDLVCLNGNEHVNVILSSASRPVEHIRVDDQAKLMHLLIKSKA